MTSSSTATALSSVEGYRRWARSYDTDPNPMLSLERRYLEPLLPRAPGIDVIDLGCGTGRWLEILQAWSPNSMLGIDPSTEMLQHAKRKLKSGAHFLHDHAGELPLATGSADLVLANFVISYVSDAAALVSNARRALREHGSLFLTDLHPATSEALHWRRGVRSDGGFQEIRVFGRAIDSVVAICEKAGLRLSARIEACFGEPEENLFEAAGKLDEYERAAGLPAIYILQFQPTHAPHFRVPQAPENAAIDSIRNARIAVGPRETVSGTICFANSRIESLGRKSEAAAPAVGNKESLDLQGYLLLPGLVNAHDHLEFALFPRLGSGGYSNCVEWAEDIHRSQAAIIAQHRQIPRDVRLWWGGLRNLLCGVTTVSHHNPYEGEVFERDFPVRVVREYDWAHSLSLDATAAEKKRQSTPGRPFLIHLGEGIDERSQAEIVELHSAGALDRDTVVIHGLALKKRGRALLRAAGAGLIWCPSSNVFLFGRTLSARVLASLPCVALGSDSPLTAEGDLLDEVRFALGASQISLDSIFHFVTSRAAQLLRLREGQGTLRVGASADLVAVRDRGLSPAAALATLSYRDIELVLLGGRVNLASESMLRHLPEESRKELQPLVIEKTTRWVRAPLERLFRETSGHLPEGVFLGGKRVRHDLPH